MVSGERSLRRPHLQDTWVRWRGARAAGHACGHVLPAAGP